jgi:selenocysteine lyase/cysteine desulfurase
MSTPESFRRHFPIFNEKIFLNSCSKGALSDDVEAAYGAYLDSWRHEGSPWDDWVAMLERTRTAIASFVGCSADEIAVSYCASTAAAGLLSALSFDGPRNRIVVGDFEFPTLVHNLLVQQKRGASVVRVRAEGNRLPAESYASELDERVLLVAASHVCFRNGYRQDVEAVVRSARSVGALTLIDDYQSTGTLPLDVRALQCDFLVTGTLKYLLGPSGLGFLYVRHELIDELDPTVTGWFGQEKPFDFDIERATYHASARRFETGTPPVPNLYAGLAGLELVRQLDLAAVRAHLTALASRLIEGAKARGWTVLTPEQSERRGPLVVLGCDDSQGAVDALAKENIVVSARGAGIRISFHYYNLADDVDEVFQVLDRRPDLMSH